MPTEPQTLHTGQRVRITGAGAPSGPAVAGSVLETATPPRLPYIRGAPAVELVREILAKCHIHQLAMITYTAADSQPVMFLALLTDHGWRDLHGNRLTITPDREP